MIRPLILAAALLAAPVAALAQPEAPAPAGGPPGGAPTPEMRAARQAMRQACEADFAKVCPAPAAGANAAPAGPGGGRQACIREHFAELSDGCKGAIQSMRAARPQG